jgi:hypothetical protein
MIFSIFHIFWRVTGCKQQRKIEGLKSARNSKSVFMQLSASEISPRNFHFAAWGSFLGRISAGICADTRQGQRMRIRMRMADLAKIASGYPDA